MSDDLTGEEREFLAEWKAKRRRRRRRILLFVGGVLLGLIVLLVAGAFVYGWYWQSKLDAKIAELRSQGKLLTWQQVIDRCNDLPPDKNSALVYQDAFKQLGPDPQDLVLELTQDMDALGTRPSPTVMELSGAEAKENAQGLKTILSAAPLTEGCYPLPSASKPWDINLKDAQRARNAVRLCGRVALCRAAEGQSDAPAPYLLAELGLASSFGSKMLGIEHLLRIACDAIALEDLQRSLALCQLAPEDLQGLRVQLEGEAGAAFSPGMVVVERSIYWAVVSELPPAVLAQRETYAERRPFGYWLIPGWRQRDEFAYMELTDEVDAIRALTPREGLAEMAQYEASVVPRFARGPMRFAETSFWRGQWWLILRQEFEAKERLSVASAALAVEQYRLKNGHWPETLDMLVPEFLEAVPEDYFGTGRITYTRTETGVLLYSVGPNGVNASGTDVSGTDAAEGLTFRLLNPDLRGAKTGSFRDEIANSGLSLDDLKAAGLDEEALKRAGLTDDDLKALR